MSNFSVVEFKLYSSSPKEEKRVYRKNLTQARAKALADKLNEKQGLKHNLDIFLTYVVEQAS